MRCGRLACGPLGSQLADVQAEFDRGDFLRTHILRPTWHLVAAEDIRWILEVTAPRVQKLNQTIYRQERPRSGHPGPRPRTDRRGAGGRAVSDPGRARPGVGRPTPRQSAPRVGLHRHERRTRRSHLQRADARRSTDLCTAWTSGRRARDADALRASANRGYQARCASRTRTGDASELARRFFLGHGPASIQDLARWSSLTISQCREALEAIKDRLDCITVEGVELWFDPDAPPVGPSSGALLVPLYDELTLSYPVINFPQANGHPHPPGEDLFVGCVIIAETNVGTWRRTVQGRKMIMEIALAPGVVRRSAALVEAAASKLATFLGKELELTITG